MKLYFHGTKKSFLKRILKNGLIIKYGRATFTTNPRYSLNYSTKKGILIVVKDPKNYIKIAKDSNIVLNKKEKIITGWVNRYRTEQYGFYPNIKKENICFDKKDIVAIFSYNNIFLNSLDQLYKLIINGNINEKKIKEFTLKLEKVLSNKNIQIIKLKIPTKEIASCMIYGMIRNLILREIREIYYGLMVFKGWEIENYGDHAAKFKKNKGEINKAIKNIGKVINKKFIDKDLKREYLNSVNILKI